MTGRLVVPTLAGAPSQDQSLGGFWASSCETRVNVRRGLELLVLTGIDDATDLLEGGS